MEAASPPTAHAPAGDPAHRDLPHSGGDCYQRAHPEWPHYTLLVLGVDPDCQGQGFGTALMQPMLQRCDRERVPAFLETAREQNVVLYERHGFRITDEVYGGKAGPKQWMMLRMPQ